MINNKMIQYKESIFTKVLNFFKKIFFRKKDEEENHIAEPERNSYREKFIENIEIKEDEEEKRLKKLQYQYENGEIEEEKISDEDIKSLIEMYNKETEELNKDTEKRKNHIAQMLKKLN